MRRAMLDAMSEDAMADAARIIQQKVREGDLAAIKLMYAYGIGKPTPAVNPDRVDVEEMQLHQQGSASPASLKAIVDNMPVATALTLGRALLPALEQRAAEQIVH